MSHRKASRSRGSSDDVPLLEVARQLGISRTTLWIRCRAGEIPGAERRGGRYVVPRSALERLLVSKSCPSEEPSHDLPAA